MDTKQWHQKNDEMGNELHEKLRVQIRELEEHIAGLKAQLATQGDFINIQEIWEAAGCHGKATSKADLIEILQGMRVAVTNADQYPCELKAPRLTQAVTEDRPKWDKEFRDAWLSI